MSSGDRSIRGNRMRSEFAARRTRSWINPAYDSPVRRRRRERATLELGRAGGVENELNLAIACPKRLGDAFGDRGDSRSGWKEFETAWLGEPLGSYLGHGERARVRPGEREDCREGEIGIDLAVTPGASRASTRVAAFRRSPTLSTSTARFLCLCREMHRAFSPMHSRERGALARPINIFSNPPPPPPASFAASFVRIRSIRIKISKIY